MSNAKSGVGMALALCKDSYANAQAGERQHSMGFLAEAIKVLQATDAVLSPNADAGAAIALKMAVAAALTIEERMADVAPTLPPHPLYRDT